MSALTAGVIAVLENPPADIDPTTGKGPEWGKAAPIGLLVILLLAIATFFLLRSMTRNLKKVPDSFDPPMAEPEGSGPTGEPADAVDPEAVDPEAVDTEPGDGEAAAPLGGPGTEQGPAGLVNDRAT